MDPAVRKQTGYIAVWVAVLSLIMEAVFLVLKQWDLSVLFGNLGGAAAAIGNFFLMALIATRAVDRAVKNGKPEEAAARVKATTMIRLLGCVLLCVIFKISSFFMPLTVIFLQLLWSFAAFYVGTRRMK